jgi:hypothetical protein
MARKLAIEDRSRGLVAAIRAAGGINALAALVGRKAGTVSQYQRVPRKYVDLIAERTGLPVDLLNDHSPAAPQATPTQETTDNGRDP